MGLCICMYLIGRSCCKVIDLSAAVVTCSDVDSMMYSVSYREVKHL